MMRTIAFIGTLLACAPAARADFSPISAEAQVKQMGRGINILGGEYGYWMEPRHSRFNDSNLADIKAQGFQNVRIPQAFSNHLNPDGTVDQRWLTKLDHIVHEATKDGLVVIIDNNNDAACEKRGEACLDLEANAWRQIASHYKNEPNTVIFELLNEPRGPLIHAWPTGYRKMLAAIRETNPYRNVIIGSVPGYSFRYLSSTPFPAEDKHIIASIHYYEPTRFTNQGAPWMALKDRPAVGMRWGTPLEVSTIQADFDYMARWSTSTGRPLYIGEFGTLEFGSIKDRAFWAHTVAKAAESHGFAWSYWQFATSFGIYDYDTQSWQQPILDAILD